MSLGLDFDGRLRKIRAPLTNSLHAIFEAVANSFDATDDLAGDGRITVRVLLEEAKMLYPDQPKYNLKGYEVEDNGVGFNDKNMDFFRQSDTTNKIGGKGVGRFLWLKVFERAEVSSVYLEGEHWRKRAFPFSVTKHGVEDKDTTPQNLDGGNQQTIVRLLAPKKERLPYLNTGAKEIAAKLLEHFLLRFAVLAGPRVTVVSPIEEPVDVASLYQEMIGDRHKVEPVDIRGKPFVLHHLFVKPTTTRKNLIRFCARRRVVVSDTVSSIIPEVDASRAVTVQGSFRYHAYVTGQYLDDIVDDERSDLRFPRPVSTTEQIEEANEQPLLVTDAEESSTEGIAKEELLSVLAVRIRDHLSSHIDDVRTKREKQLEDFAHQEQPQFRPFVASAKKNLERLPARPSKKAIEIALYEAKIDGRLELDKAVDAIVKGSDTWQQLGEQKKQLMDRFVTAANQHAISALAEYVCTRKAVINVLKSNHGKNFDEKNQYELPIHDLFFPRSYTSNELPVGAQEPGEREIENLWLIDERLVFHRLLASDKPLSTLRKLTVAGHTLDVDTTKKNDEPDILIFDPALVTAESDNFSSLAIVEFKRPGRDDYTLSKNPIQQVIEIASKIRKAKRVESKSGQIVAISSDVRLYGYAICDIRESLDEMITNTYKMKQMPDGIGFYDFHEPLNMLMEVIPYSKIISDAEKRNAAFFKKLNM